MKKLLFSTILFLSVMLTAQAQAELTIHGSELSPTNRFTLKSQLDPNFPTYNLTNDFISPRKPPFDNILTFRTVVNSTRNTDDDIIIGYGLSFIKVRSDSTGEYFYVITGWVDRLFLRGTQVFYLANINFLETFKRGDGSFPYKADLEKIFIAIDEVAAKHNFSPVKYFVVFTLD